MKNSALNKSEVSTFKPMNESGEEGDEGGGMLEASLVEEKIPEEDLWHLRQREITSEARGTGVKEALSGDNAKSNRYRAERIFVISVATVGIFLCVVVIIVMLGVVNWIAYLFKGFATGEIPMH